MLVKIQNIMTMGVVKQTWIILGMPRQVSESKEYLTL